ncbi:MAG: hypothetical protein IKA79_01615 [Lentisphaeria bacterium]|nr:hypothetical protein [Lentisphaeria bacterium]
MNSNMKNCLPGADRFCTGVNYRASHAGINMWKDFSPEEMEKDFIALKESGMNTILTRNPADSGFLQPFASIFGCEVEYRTEVPEELSFDLNGRIFTTRQSITRRLKKISCDVLAENVEDHSPVIVAKSYGKGKVIFVNAALENSALEEGNCLYMIYGFLAEMAGTVTEKGSPAVGITKHTLPDGKTLKLYINYSAEIPVTGWRATV